MTRSVDKITRFDAGLFDDAVAEGERQHRSGRQQLEHWARVGRSMTAVESAALSRIRDAIAGDLPLEDLDAAEGRVFNAEVDARIVEHLGRVDYVDMLAAQGVVTVSLDGDGRLVETRPDGSTRLLDDE